MKKITKTIGYIGLSAALLRMPHGQAVTLEQLNAFLEACRRESIQNLEDKKALLNALGDSEAKSESEEKIRKLLEIYNNKQNIHYDENGNLNSVETIGFSLIKSPAFDLLGDPFCLYNKSKWNNWIKENGKENPLNIISRELSDDALKQHGVDMEEIKKSGIGKIREITFDSILRSPFFNDTQREKAKTWLENADSLKIAIRDYADHCVPYERKKLHFSQVDTNLYISLAPGEDAGRVKEKRSTPVSYTYSDFFIPKPENEFGKWRQKIQSALEGMLRYKSGKEKVILLLLLDEMTPSDIRVKWIFNRNKKSTSPVANSQYSHCNAFLFEDIGEMMVSHEIGHYLQNHLGLTQTFSDYQNLFAKELLLLKNNLSNDVMFEIPTPIQKKVSQFDGASYQQTLSAKACFEYCQLIARWESWHEISNILGVYFKGDTLYVHALSDIRELKRIRYGHNAKICGKAITKSCALLEDTSIKQAFASICNEAFGKSAPTEALRLLCQLHGRASEDAENVVCDFDYDGQECAEKVEPALMDFIEAGQP